MFENIDLSRPLKDPLIVAFQLLQNSAVLLWLLEVGEGDAWSQVDFLTQWLEVYCVFLVFIMAGGQVMLQLYLVFVILVEVLGVLNIVSWVGSHGIVVRSAVEVITTVRISRVLFNDLLSDAQHRGEENTMRLEPVHVGVPGDGGAEERSEVIVSINNTEKTIRAVSLPAQSVVSVANLEPSQPPPGNGLVLGWRIIVTTLSLLPCPALPTLRRSPAEASPGRRRRARQRRLAGWSCSIVSLLWAEEAGEAQLQQRLDGLKLTGVGWLLVSYMVLCCVLCLMFWWCGVVWCGVVTSYLLTIL